MKFLLNVSMRPPLDYRTAMNYLNYATPIVVAISYVSACVLAWSTLQSQRGCTISKIRKTALVGTSFAITVSYAASALYLCRYLATVSDDVLVHAISQALLWLTLSLVSVNTVRPVLYVWLSTSILNLGFEGATCILTYILARRAGPDYLYAIGGFQTLTCFLLVCHAGLLLQFRTTEAENSETQSLLRKSSKSPDTSSGSEVAYRTVNSDERFDNDYEDSDESESNDGNASDEDDDGDKEMRNLLQQRLESNGDWWSYIKEFKVFLPHLIPARNLRIQLYLGLLVFNTLAIRALIVLEPRQLGLLIDAMTTQHSVPWKEIFVWILLKIAASSSCGINAANEMLENRIEAWSHLQLSIASFDHVMGLSMGFHDEKDSGEIIKAIEQAGALNTLLRALIVDIIPGGLDMFIAMFYVAHLFDVYALLVMFAVGILFVFSTYYLTKIMTAARRVSAKKDRDETKLIYESVSNWFTISYFNRKNYVMSRLSQVAQDEAKVTLWSSDLYTYLYFVQDFLEVAGLLAMTVLAARRVFNGTSTVGDFVNLQSYWYSITLPLYILSRSYRTLNSRLVDAERLLQLFKESPVVQDSLGARHLQLGKGEVVFDSVSFAYPGRQSTLNKLDFVARPGQMTALVGETGSGKSTIFKLLMRFHDVTDGRITVDGQDLRDVTVDSLRESFGFVPQDNVLFNMSILENVRYGRLNASDEEVYAACRAASIHDKILGFPKGYASKVGERGVKLSGGERQRIAIARVFLKGAPIVLLDEATSAMDSQTEAKIQQALKNLIRGKTTFVIAHRLSTVVEADRILVIDNGQVVESGTHQELLQHNGRYLELWKKQAALAS